MNDNFHWDILDNYFNKGGSPESVNPHVKHQIDSYNKFIDNTLEHIIVGFNPIKIVNTLKNDNGDTSHKIYINIIQPSLTKPIHYLQDGTQTVMTPHIARMNKLTYSSSLYVNVNVNIEAVNGDGVIENYSKTINGVYIGKIPVMVRSKSCILQQMPCLGEENNSECRYDYGGYFIINGSEKVLVSQDRINENKTLVFQPNHNNEGLYAEIRSMSDSTYLPPKTTSLNMSGKLNHMGRIIRLSTSFIKSEVPVFVMFRALGVISDKDIIQHIVYDMDNVDNQRIITELMACCEDACEVHTQEQAEAMIIRVMTGANKAINPKELLINNIANDFLPHVGKCNMRKALYLGYMIRKMIRIYLGYDTYDNRDSYMNKRIDTPGILLSNLFRQCYGKMTKEIKTLIERELNLWRANQNSIPTCDIINDNNIHRYFRQSLLESWLKYSLSTGNWGIKSIGNFQNIKQGVSQVLNRLSYASTLSHLRKINTSMEKNGKLVQPRKLDNSQMGMICPAETPEGASVGLVKNMALSTNISVYMNSSHIRNLLEEHGVIVYDDSYVDKVEKRTDYLKNMGNKDNVYVQINGDIIGYHTDPVELYSKLKHYKRCGLIYPMTSIIWNIKHRTIIISTEAGRMYRPLLIVDYDKNTGKRELRISKILREKNITWEEFNKNKIFDEYIAPCASVNNEFYKDMSYDNEEEGFIEYLDCDEINHAMIALYPSDLEKGMKGISYSPFYTHCEIHPSLMNGILGVNIPFSDHNQSPRNCYQCISENEKVLMSNGTYKMIKNIQIGDEVICFNLNTKKSEHTKVVNHYNRLTTKMVYTITLVSGRTITATNDHKFMTNEGWKDCTEFDKNTLLGVHINRNYDINLVEGNSDEFVILDIDENTHNFWKEIDILPLKNDNTKLNVIAKLAGYYVINGLKFSNEYIENKYNDDVKYIGFQKYGIYDTRFILFIQNITKNIDWVHKCSMNVKKEFVSGYLSAVYPKNIEELKENPIELIEDIKELMKELQVNVNWYENNNNIIDFQKKIGIRYNNEFLNDVAIIAEYVMHKNYCNTVNIDKIRKIYSIEKWKQDVYIEGDLIFVPFNIKYKSNNYNISDITVESDNHNFIAGNGFAVSNCAMGKQALGIYASNFNRRIDTMGNILNYAQKPLVYTKLSKYTYSNELPSGINAIVAIMTHTGFNQEDSVMINQSALDRGLFTSTYYKSVKDQCTKNHSTGEEEVFTNPLNCDAVSLKPFSYSKLNEDGFVPKNTFVEGSDIIIGKVMPKKSNGVIVNNDNSMSIKANDDGFIDMNYVGTNSDGYKFCNVRLRKNRKPEVGDKLACYSPDHQYLTTDGWIPVAELTLEHKVASMVNGELVYQKPVELHSFDYTGLMYYVKNDNVDLLVTPNHRMLYKTYYEGTEYQVKKAEEIYHKRYRMKNNIDIWKPNYENIPKCLKLNNKKTKITHFKFPAIDNEEFVMEIDNWITLYSIYISNGLITNGVMQISTSNKIVKYALNDVINNSGIEVERTIGYVNILNNHIARYIEQKPDSFQDQDWVWYLDREQCQTLMYSICLVADIELENESMIYETFSDKLADGMQRLCLHAGFACKKNIDNTEEKTKYILTIMISHHEPIINGENNYQDNMINYTGKVYCCTIPKGDGIVYVRRNNIPIWCGQSRSAQKGSIGMIYRHQDMPFTKQGIVPDVIMNPHAIPSRMTMAQLMECIMGKASCHIGACGDSTPFTDCSVESISKVLEMSGLEKYGNEIMYNGRTGEQIQTEIFIGPTYYQRLKHMVTDKIHARGSNGPIVMLTRQPSEGRARAGGLRLGEMERDCLIGHGISEFLKEKMLDTSDNYRIFVCKNCGLTANANPAKNIYKCSNCKTSADIVQVRIPYAFKLLGQELYTMNIKMGFNCA